VHEKSFFLKGPKNAAIYTDNNTLHVKYPLSEILNLYLNGVELERAISNVLSVDSKSGELLANIVKKFIPDRLVIGYPRPIEKREIGLRVMWIEVTGRCNLRCLHCYTSSSVSVSSKLSPPVVMQLLEEGASLGCRIVQFTGGEPLILKDELVKFVHHAHKLGYELIEVFSNLTMLTDKILKSLHGTDVFIATSLYSHRSEVHDKITRSKGSFAKTVNNIKKVLKSGVKFRVGMITMDENRKDIAETVKFLQNLGVKSEAIRVSYVCPSGRGKEVYSSSQFKSFIPVDKQWGVLLPFACWSGKVSISSEGFVYPCPFARNLPIGSYPDNTLKEIVKNAQDLWNITVEDVEVCRDCELRFSCINCRTLSTNITGKICSKIPICHYDPYSGKINQEELKSYTEKSYPTKKEGLEEVWEGNELIVFDPENMAVHILRGIAPQIWQMCTGEFTPDEITDEISNALKLDREQVVKDVEKTLKNFSSRKLLK
jgi:radical SAM protein with 4Fe4S-binding SPASM domain